MNWKISWNLWEFFVRYRYNTPNIFLVLWDNDSKHKQEMSFDDSILNKIKLLKWTSYIPDLNQVENLWGNNKYKSGGLYIKRYNILSQILMSIG